MRRFDRSGISRRVLSAVLSAALVLNGPFGLLTAVQAQVVSDPRAPIQFQPRVGAAPNGTPVIDVTKPSFGGLSHNKFDQYNVDTRGVILNNSGLAGTSILGGQVWGNPNLANSRPASVILNEVTGSTSSLLNGPTEVFGSKADVIVANPNGVNCSSCSFINTGRVTLSTGVPIADYDRGTVSFSVTRGKVTIEGTGVSAFNSDGTATRIGNLDLVGRQIEVNAPINASDSVRMRSGAINWNQTSDVATQIAGAAPITGPGIVSGVNGIIQAGTISAISYDLNVGIQFNGDLTALGIETPDGRGGVTKLSGLVAVSSAGDLAIANAGSTGDLRYDAAGALSLNGTQQAMGRLTGSGNTIAISNVSVIANDAIVLEALRDIMSRGVLQAGTSISVVGGGTVTASGSMVAKDQVDIEGSNIATNEFQAVGSRVTVAGLYTIDLEKTILAGQDRVSVLGQDVRLGEGTAFQAGTDNSGVITIDVRGTLTNATTLNYPNLTLNLGRSLINETTGQIVADNLALTLSDSVINAGLLYGRISTLVSAGDLTNQGSGIIYGPEVTVSVSNNLINAGKILSEGKLAVTALGAVQNDGAIQANGAVTLRSASYVANSAQAILAGATAELIVAGAFDNAGSVQGVNGLMLSATSLTNRAGAKLYAGGAAILTLSGDVNNAGNILVDHALSITTQRLLNSGAIESSDLLYAKARGDFSNSGQMTSASDISLEVGGVLRNTGSVVAAASIAATSAGNIDNIGGAVQADGMFLETSGALTNSGTVLANSDLMIKAVSLSNTGVSGSTAMISGKSLTMVVTNGLVNGPFSLIEGTDRASISAATSNLDLTHTNGVAEGMFNFGKDLGYQLTGQGLTIDASKMLMVDGKLMINVAGDIVVLGSIASRENLDLVSGGSITIGNSDPNNPGGAYLYTKGDGYIKAAGNLTNYASVIESIGNLMINVGGELRNTRTATTFTTWSEEIQNNSTWLYVHVEEKETSDAAIINAGGSLAIKAGSIFNLGSTISAGVPSDPTQDSLVIEAGSIRNETRLLARYYDLYKTGCAGSGGDCNKGHRGTFPEPSVETTALIYAVGTADIRGGTRIIGEGSYQAETLVMRAPNITVGITDPNVLTALPRVPDPVIDISAYWRSFTGPGGDTRVTIDGITYMHARPFTDARERGPGWILSQVGDVRGGVTFFMDPTSERLAIQQALIAQTGRAILDPKYRNPAEQQEALWQATVDFLKANPDIKLGDTLTAEQRAKISQPILWYSEKTIDGEKVLVPELLLPLNRLEEWTKNAGGEMVAGDIFMRGDTIHNTGSILATDLLVIDAGTFLNERRTATNYATVHEKDGLFGPGTARQISFQEVQSGGVLSGASLYITTDGDLINRGGLIAGTSLVDLFSRHGNIINEAVENQSVVEWKTSAFGKQSWDRATNFVGGSILSGGDLYITAAEGSVINRGSSIAAFGNIDIFADKGFTNEALTATWTAYDKGGCKLSGCSGQRYTTGTIEPGSVRSVAGDVNITVKNGDIVNRGSMILSDFGSVMLSADNIIIEGVSREDTYKTWGLKWGAASLTYNYDKGNGFQYAPSVIGAGKDVILIADNDIRAKGVQIAAGRDILGIAGGSITFDADEDTRWSKQGGWQITASYPGSTFLDTLSKGGSLADAARAHAANDPLLGAVVGLANAKDGSQTASAIIRAGVAGIDTVGGWGKVYGALGGDGLADVGKSITDKLNPFSSPSFGIGVSAWSQKSQWSESHSSSLEAGRDITLLAGDTLNLLGGTSVSADRDITLSATNGINIEAQRDWSHSSGHNWNASVGYKPGNGTSAWGITITGGGGYNKSEGETYKPAQIIAGGNLSIDTGGDLTIRGGILRGNTVDIAVGGNMWLESLQDMTSSRSQQGSVGVTIGPGYAYLSSLSYSESDGDSRWTNSVSEIVSNHGMNINVAGKTTMIGATIASLDGDMTLRTGDLEVRNLEDYDKLDSFGFSFTGIDKLFGNASDNKEAPKSGNGNSWIGAIGVKAEGHDKEGTTFSVIGEGKVIIGGDENHPIMAGVKRDLEGRQIVTVDDSYGFSLEIPLVDLKSLQQSASSAANFFEALTTQLPDNVTAQGPTAELIARRMIANGVDPAKVAEIADTEAFGRTVQVAEFVKGKEAAGQKIDILDRALILSEYKLYPPDHEFPMGSVDVACSTQSSRCRVALDKFKELMSDERRKEVIYKALDEGGRTLAGCASSVTCVGQDRADLYAYTDVRDKLLPTLLQCALEEPAIYTQFVKDFSGDLSKISTALGTTEKGMNLIARAIDDGLSKAEVYAVWSSQITASSRFGMGFDRGSKQAIDGMIGAMAWAGRISGLAGSEAYEKTKNETLVVLNYLKEHPGEVTEKVWDGLTDGIGKLASGDAYAWGNASGNVVTSAIPASLTAKAVAWSVQTGKMAAGDAITIVRAAAAEGMFAKDAIAALQRTGLAFVDDSGKLVIPVAQVVLNREAGVQFERAVLEALSGVKNTTAVTVVLDSGKTVTTIFDGMGKSIGGLLEIKDVKSIFWSDQFRAQITNALETKVPLNLVVSHNTQRITGTLVRDIKRTGGDVYVYNPTTGILTPF